MSAAEEERAAEEEEDEALPTDLIGDRLKEDVVNSGARASLGPSGGSELCSPPRGRGRRCSVSRFSRSSSRRGGCSVWSPRM